MQEKVFFLLIDVLESLLPFSEASLVQWWQQWCTSSGLTVCCKTQSRRRPSFLAWRPFRPHAPERCFWLHCWTPLRFICVVSDFRRSESHKSGQNFHWRASAFPPSSLSPCDFSLSFCLSTLPYFNKDCSVSTFTQRHCFSLLLLLESLDCS